MIYSVLDACEYTLEIEGDPQSPYWFASMMIEMRIWKASEQKIREALDKDIAKSGESSRFVKVADDEYALRSSTTKP